MFIKKFYQSRRFMEQAGESGDPGSGSAPPAGSTPPSAAWYDNFQDPSVKEWLKNYGDAYPNPEAVATKALNLEKFIGAEKAGRGIITPKADAKPEEWQEFYKKVGGVPEKPDGYKLPAALSPEIQTQMAADPMVQAFREHAHKSGMPPVFFESAMQWYTEQMANRAEADVNEFAAQSEKDMADIKNEWKGIEYDKNVEMGRRAAKQFIPHENLQELQDKMARIEGALGTKETLKLWAAIGNSMGEHGFEGGEGGGGMTGMSPEAARMRIDALKKDSGFIAKITNGDAESKNEWDRLHKIAYPE